MMNRLLPILLPALLLAGPAAPLAAELAAEEGYALARQLMSEKRGERRDAMTRLNRQGDRSWIPVVADALFFIPAHNRREALKVLESLSGERVGQRYFDWVEFVGGSPQVLPPGYAGWKSALFQRIDRRYRGVFYEGFPSHIRLEEVVWGGVKLDGIPALEAPEQVTAAQADFLRDSDRVFGVSLGGDTRAYPLKVLGWHEMLNDVVGGEPVTLSYCTLCGSGVLFSTRTSGGGSYTFGTSGLLYRSNKLMFDRQTYSLWSNLTGEAVIGRKAVASAKLEMLPMTLTTWKGWRTLHPETTVMRPDPELARRFGFRYDEGAADRARSGVSFPVWQKSQRLERGAEVYAMRLDGKAKAWPIELVLEERLVNDHLGEIPLVLIGEAKSGSIRAYERGRLTFSPGRGAGELIDDQGRVWRVGEDALAPSADDLAELPRLPGHVAFWFGWYGFYPGTELYEGG